MVATLGDVKGLLDTVKAKGYVYDYNSNSVLQRRILEFNLRQCGYSTLFATKLSSGDEMITENQNLMYI